MGYREDYFEHNKSNHGWYTCVRCGGKFRKSEIDVDHIIPQKYGGSDHLNNLQCMCKHCNRSKQDDVGLDTVKDLSRNVVKNAARKKEEKKAEKKAEKKKEEKKKEAKRAGSKQTEKKKEGKKSQKKLFGIF